jgi:hypothetical protein
LRTKTKSLSLLTGEDCSYDNWILTDGNNFLSGSVTDKRWEKFEVIKTPYKKFTLVQSVSFSLYSPVAVNLFVNDDKDLDFTYIEHEFQKGWNHISIFLRNNSIFYFLNNKEIKSMNAFHYHEIVVQENTTNIFWKIHNCTFQISL